MNLIKVTQRPSADHTPAAVSISSQSKLRVLPDLDTHFVESLSKQTLAHSSTAFYPESIKSPNAAVENVYRSGVFKLLANTNFDCR